MRLKILLLGISFLGFTAAKANNGPDPETGCNKVAGCDKKKGDEINGVIVHAESKKPIKDVSVTAYLVTKKEKNAVSDDEGGYSFDELKPGTYRFVFEKAGFKRVTKERVVIKTDEAFQLNIEMIESRDSDLMPSPFHF
ncbi:MAG: carboxypeptidase regulatory-like domain-containing protein [Chitinophagaceae bacterium]|nr:carboxypeptidase regulatory-like domain-containing protein [Chitinophagaceae bacterium]